MKVALYNPYLETKGGGEKLALTIAEILSKEPETTVHLVAHNEIDIASLESYFNLDLKKVKVLEVDLHTPLGKIIHRLPMPGRLRNLYNDLRVKRAVKQFDFDIFINGCYHSNLPNVGARGIYLCMFPQVLDGNSTSKSPIKKAYVITSLWLSRLILHPAIKRPVDTYQTIISISKFTEEYVYKYWDRDSVVLSPVCEDMFDAKHNKSRRIVHVGRFFENIGNSHHKRQDALLQAFSEMTDLHQEGWELHFIGSVAENTGALKYILSLMKAAEGLPVFFHFNSSFAELKELYNTSTIYWHATGFGSDAKKYPEKQEHFGITTIEAMSAGCIPIVINTAGQKESVTNGQNGYLWDSLDQLRSRTTHVAGLEKKDSEELSKTAIATAKLYDKKSFRKNLLAIISDSPR